MRAICQLLSTLLVGILGEAKDDGWKPCKPAEDYVTDAFCTYEHYYMELKRYNRPAGHTERTIAVLEHLGARFLGILGR